VIVHLSTIFQDLISNVFYGQRYSAKEDEDIGVVVISCFIASFLVLPSIGVFLAAVSWLLVLWSWLLGDIAEQLLR